jgi:glucose-6-phosphate-specific signal transduction histidine kinase
MSSGVTSNRRWQRSRPLLVLAASAVPAFTAIRLRDHYGWEDTDALVALGATCGSAAALAGAVTLAWRRQADLAVAYALLAAVLVAPLIVLYYFVRMAATADYS